MYKSTMNLQVCMNSTFKMIYEMNTLFLIFITIIIINNIFLHLSSSLAVAFPILFILVCFTRSTRKSQALVYKIVSVPTARSALLRWCYVVCSYILGNSNGIKNIYV